MEDSHLQLSEWRLSRRQALKAGAIATVGLASPWLADVPGPAPALASSGPAASSSTGTWKAITWESSEEMKKWRLHIGHFFKQYYPKWKWQVDYGIDWLPYWTKLQTIIAGGASPDMCWMHDTRVESFASRGLLEPLDPYLQRDRPIGWAEKFYPSQVNSFQYQGNQYGFPYDWAAGGLYVNLDLLKRAKVDIPTEDWTYDDLLEAAKRIKAAAKSPDRTFGVSLPTDSANSYIIVRSFGGEFFSGNPLKAHFTNPGTVKAYQYLYDAMWKHKVMPNPAVFKAMGITGDITAFFASGNVGMFWSLNDEAFVMNDLIGGKFRWTVAPTPKGVHKRYQFVGGSAFSIPKGSPHPDLTYQVIKYVLSTPQNLPITGRMGSMFVSRKDYWKYGVPPANQVDPKRYKHTFYDLGRRDGTHPLYFPNYAQWDASVYARYMGNLWANQQHDVAAVLQQVQAATEPLLQSS